MVPTGVNREGSGFEQRWVLINVCAFVFNCG